MVHPVMLVPEWRLRKEQGRGGLGPGPRGCWLASWPRGTLGHTVETERGTSHGCVETLVRTKAAPGTPGQGSLLPCLSWVRGHYPAYPGHTG